MVEKTKSEQRPAVKSKKGFYAVWLAVAALLVGAGWWGWQNPQVRARVRQMLTTAPSPHEEDVWQAQINVLRGEIMGLQRQIEALSVQRPDLKPIEEKISAIEKMNLNVIDSKADISTLLGVVTRLDKAEHKIDKLSMVTDESALNLTALMLVKDAAERGEKFVYEAEVLSQLTANNPKLAKAAAKMETLAQSGIVSAAELQTEFERFYAAREQNEAVDKEAAKSWKERVNSKLKQLVRIKKTNVNAPSAEKNAIEQISDTVAAGNLTAAADLLAAESEYAENAMAQEWIAKVRTRAEFYDLIDSMSANALAAMKVRFLQNRQN